MKGGGRTRTREIFNHNANGHIRKLGLMMVMCSFASGGVCVH